MSKLNDAIKMAKDGQSKIARSNIERFLVSEKRDNRSKEFHPSSAEACGRAVVMGMLDTSFQPDPIDPNLALTFGVGNYLHMMIQDLLIKGEFCADDERYQEWEKKLKEFCETEFQDSLLIQDNRLNRFCRDFRRYMNPNVEVPVSHKKINIVGHSDALVVFGGNEYILDIKTINSRRFDFQLKEPPYKDKIQLLVYMYLLAKTKGILFYYCKDNNKTKEFYIKMEDYSEVVQVKMDWFKYLKECVAVGRLPERPTEAGVDEKMCKFCYYKKPCWAGTVVTIARSPF